MSDVARAAGVSVTTVSHVVNRTRPVAADTEHAVLAALAHAGYIPDGVVRSMRATATKTLGLAMSAMSNTYFGDVVHSIEEAAARAGFSLLLADTHDEVTAELRAVSQLLSRRVDAIVLAPSADPSGALRHAGLQGVPVVLIDRMIDGEWDQVAVENDEPTATLVDHLASLGHQRVAMISGKAGLVTTAERVAGYRRGLVRNGLPFRRQYVVSGESTDDVAKSALHTLLALPRPPSAVVVGNNRMMIGVLRGTREAGIKVAEDLAVVGFDDFEWADLFHPGLTVIRQPTRAMGEQAVELALSRLAAPSTPARRVLMPATFVHRESCGCGAA